MFKVNNKNTITSSYGDLIANFERVNVSLEAYENS